VDWENKGSLLGRTTYFSHHHHIQARSYAMGTESSFPRGKATTALSRPLTEINNAWIYASIPSKVFAVWCTTNYIQAQLYLI
jgi:hypothetical protein